MPILGTAQNASAKLACDCAGVFQISKIGKLHFCLLTIQLLEYPPKKSQLYCKFTQLQSCSGGTWTTHHMGRKEEVEAAGLVGLWWLRCRGIGAACDLGPKLQLEGSFLGVFFQSLHVRESNFC